MSTCLDCAIYRERLEQAVQALRECWDVLDAIGRDGNAKFVGYDWRRRIRQLREVRAQAVGEPPERSET